MNAASQSVAEAPPASEHLTDYDRKHLKTYLRLLDAAAEDADWREVATVVLGLDPTADPERSRRVHAAHLERARWMTRVGYRDLLLGRYAH
ncbi:MAG: DUF2285 domain-containing protein [Sphingomonadaceae bacterium]|nr:DUF2285 domain-containing protein [Sphingomonadaceae bacterium]